MIKSITKWIKDSIDSSEATKQRQLGKNIRKYSALARGEAELLTPNEVARKIRVMLYQVGVFGELECHISRVTLLSLLLKIEELQEALNEKI